ncbi:hypothetical protein DICPUDRAFT_84421 [Dictyostelium purpureum]|uniref:Ubiquitin-like domain-containing protein n=1 Tax=Dictyostelium purpureum TaxID=5786 RepID=F1A2L0_DICPU|nr:uncharacterized protein DICPUDRAFT_84421 [Dictyostelium purpureum]EGC29570.1 hypothetical protein DICPUDRAFT_84421 [Dictyostelium purpureum]|eukprot:XP_003293902.1 hypothetical protein DICPUDRAFT_84421 [Dictyostelium purpureum]
MNILLKAGLKSVLNVDVVEDDGAGNQNEVNISYVDYSQLIHGIRSQVNNESNTLNGNGSSVVLNIFIRNFVGKFYQISTESNISILSLKKYLNEKYEQNIEPDKMVLLYGSKVLANNMALSDYCIRNDSTVTLFISNNKVKISNVFEPSYDHDFTFIRDVPNQFYRGGRVYNRPCGSKRFALSVLNRFTNYNNWLGTDQNSWPVSYHASLSYIDIKNSILSKHPQIQLNSHNEVLTTPSFELAKTNAHIFTFEGIKYYIVFQNRINPQSITTIKLNDGNEYWKSLATSDHLRPYSICIQKV